MTWATKIAEHRERQAAAKESRIANQGKTIMPRPQSSYEGNTGRAVPKTVPYRDPVLLEMARDRVCLLRVATVCASRETVVACHSNLRIHGKGKARKADDQYSAWGCFACHAALDAGGLHKQIAESLFMLAHMRQVHEWRMLAQDPSEPERYRNAARRALEALNATALPEDGDG